MISWFLNNLASVIICILIGAAVVLVVIKLISDKKSGKSGCSCGCENCPSSCKNRNK